ncbi:class I adenylate-forming enzyme family protein [Lentzea sp. NPDC051838]|uniref:class I adenylate-forming enzyme family protein n=1 Tax=Lentzea sp. NPDC051838 TaxID=3154849 RepID=UPI0034303209
MSTDSWWGAALLHGGEDDAVWARGAEEITHGRLRAEVARLAELFRLQGIRGGDVVALQGTASFTQLWAMFALWSLGTQVVHLGPHVTRAERAALFELCGPRHHVVLGGRRVARGAFADECEVAVLRLPSGRRARTGHCLVQFSSGTTGGMKAVGRTPESLLNEVHRFAAIDGMPGRGERVLVLDPITHSFSLVGGVLHALNARAVLMFSHETISDADVVLGTPRHFERIAAARREPSRLRLAVSSGEALPQRVYDTFADRFGVHIGQAYGTTETGIVATDLRGEHGPRTVGVPLPGVATRVRHGVLEVLVAQSPYLYSDDDRWQGGGWLSTQDLVTLDPRTGAVRLRGRAGAGADPQVDLLEIEAVLRGHRLVSDVVVLGADVVEAHVEGPAELTRDELTSWCRWLLGDVGVPSRFHVTSRLPATANGKTLRSRELLLAHLTRAS